MRSLFARWPLLLAIALLAACGASTSPTPGPTQTKLLATTVASDYANVVTQLYVSYFGRPADSGGYANFKARMAELNAPTEIQALDGAYKTSAPLRELIDSFGSSDESKALYSGDTATFVTAIYTNVLGRAPDTAGKNFWVGELDSGKLTRANASLAIMAGALTNTTAQGLADGALIRNRITVAINFSNALVGDFATAYSGAVAAATARAMLSTVTATTDPGAFQSTVTSTLTAMAQPTTGQPPPVTLYTPIPAIIKARCAGCHSANPTLPGFFAPFELDTSAQIHAQAGKIYQSSVLTRVMPSQGNITGMTDAERSTIAKWVEGGAP
jgi:mono/diheme cytochrome c family protein